MRLVEALFLASLAAAFLLGFTSLAGLGRLAASVLLVGGLLLVHLTVDGARWQMIPAYASAFGLAALVAGRLFGPAPTLWPYGAALGLVGVLAAAAAGLAVPVFRLPAPPGPYPIGTSSIALTDWGRADPFTGEPGRRLVAQIWYPAQAGTGVGLSHRRVAEAERWRPARTVEGALRSDPSRGGRSLAGRGGDRPGLRS